MAIRTLAPGDTAPTTEPRRYKSAHGYVRLRWPVGKGQLVEAYEHRLVAGAGPSDHVHHLNGVKDDNRPENLVLMTAAEHTAHHMEEQRTWDVAEATRLYEGGMGTPELGAIMGVNGATVYRQLRRNGVRMRGMKEAAALSRIQVDEKRVRALMAAGAGDRTIATALGISDVVVARRRKEWGIAPRRRGRLTKEEVARLEELAG